MATVSVIVVNMNRRDLLERCLASLWAQTFKDFEVIVVDNGSRDGSVEFVRRQKRPALRVVSLPTNRGFDGGCNAGLASAGGCYVATLNNDAEADREWLENLVRAMEADSAVGMCASKMVLMEDPHRIDKAGHLIYFDGLNHGRGSGEIDCGQFDREEEVLFPDGAAALYRRAMLDEVGRFDESFVAYGDDCDLGLRGRWAGWSCRYVPRAVVRHIHSATAGEYSTFKAFLIERNRIWVALKNFPLGLLLVSPLFTAVRLLFHVYGALFDVGSSGAFARGTSRKELAGAMLSAWVAAVKGAAPVWRERRRGRSFRRLGTVQFLALLWKHRISVRDLTLRG